MKRRSGSSQPAQTPRILGLDALRGVAVVLMIQQHLGIWHWIGPEAGKTRFDYPLLVAFNALGGGAAPMFVVLAGIGCALLMARRSGSVDRTLFLRGLTLMGFGYLLSLITPSWFTWRSWYVLHLMGFGMCVVPLLRRLSNGMLLLVAASIVALAPVFQAWLDTPTYMSNARMAGWEDLTGAKLLAGGHARMALAEGQFPVFPWMSLFVVGFVAGRWVLEQRFGNIVRLGAASALAGGAMMGLYFAGVGFARDLQRVFGFNIPFFPSTTSTILVIGGLVLLAIGAIFTVEERYRLTRSNVMVVLGRASLTLLIVHVWFFRQLRPFDWWKSLPPDQVALLIAGALITFALLARLWRRVDYRFGAEWLLRRVGRLGSQK